MASEDLRSRQEGGRDAEPEEDQNPVPERQAPNVEPRLNSFGSAFRDAEEGAGRSIPNPSSGSPGSPGFLPLLYPPHQHVPLMSRWKPHRLQAWDLSNLPHSPPDLGDRRAGLIVPQCWIQNDASVDVSSCGRLLAALVPGTTATTTVGVFSILPQTLGQLLYSFIFTPNTVCVSLSPAARHLVVGFASYGSSGSSRFLNRHYRDRPNQQQLVAQIYKLVDNQSFQSEGQAGHLQLLREIEINCEHRSTSLNCIRWLPYPGEGLIYGSNQGALNILECR